MAEVFQCDHIGFTKRGKPFLPHICYGKEIGDLDLFNVMMLSVDCSLSSNLKWDAVKVLAKNYVEQEKALFWNLNFNLEGTSFYNQAALSSFLLAIRNFTEELFFPFAEQTFGVCLYQGLPLNSFKWNIEHEEAYRSWQENYSTFPAPKELYQIKIFSEYLHRLAAALPDEALPFALFKAPLFSPAYLAQLLSREYFSYLYIGLTNHQLPLGPLDRQSFEARVGLTLPLHSFCSKKSISCIDACIKDLNKSGVPFRLIAESHLTECWDGLDDLILFSEYMSPQGRRKAQGFAAAGGRLIVQGNPIQIGKEISWDEFRGRGI